MARKPTVMLPENVRPIRSGGKVYHYHEIRRKGFETPRIRIPYSPDDPRFWAEAARLNGVAPERAGTIAAMVATWKLSPGYLALSTGTRRDYTRYLDRLVDRIGDYAPREVTPPVMATLRDGYGERRSTANHFLAVMTSLWGWAVEAGLAPANPARDVKRHALRSTGAQAWDDGSIAAVLAPDAPEDLRWFCGIALFTGQRTADIVRMTLHDFRDGFVRVRSGKTGEPDWWIPIHRDFVPIVAEMRRRKRIVLFPSRKHGKMTAQCWRARWQRLRADDPLRSVHEAGLSPHGLRKSCVSRLRESGCTIEEIMATTRQSRPVVEHYARDADHTLLAASAMTRAEASRRFPTAEKT